MFKMAAVSLDAHPGSFGYVMCNLLKNSVINATCSIANWLKCFISCVHLAFIHPDIHITTHIGI